MQPVSHPRVFSNAWFARHQRTLLALLRTPVIGRELRAALAIRRHDVGWDGRIVRLTPHSYTVANDDGTFTTDFRTHAKYGKRLYHQVLPLWKAAHAWDQFVANPLVPALNVGFDTLQQYPDSDPETTTTDGWLARDGVDESWATIRAGAGSSVLDTVGSQNIISIRSFTTSNGWNELVRSGPSFLLVKN